MILTKEDVYEMCGDFKDLVKGKYFDDYLTDLDLKLLNTRDCVVFSKEKRYKETGVVEREEVTSIQRDHIMVRKTESHKGKLVKFVDIVKPLTELQDYRSLLAPNKVVMSEIGRYYKSR